MILTIRPQILAVNPADQANLNANAKYDLIQVNLDGSNTTLLSTQPFGVEVNVPITFSTLFEISFAETTNLDKRLIIDRPEIEVI